MTNNTMDETVALVLSGGNALGAYHAGAWSALRQAGIVPGWVAGCSIGAVTAAIIAGNAPDAVEPALQRFWDEASSYEWSPPLWPRALRDAVRYGHALSSRLFGRPGLFTLRTDAFGQSRPGRFDVAPMRRLLGELVDLERLNSGAPRLSVLAIDLQSGQEVVFDTRHRRIKLDHILASVGLIPDFRPVAVDGRLLVDGGLAANLPLHLVLGEARDAERTEPLTCFAVDLFPLAAPLPQGLLQAAQRQSDLLFASQTQRSLQSLTRLWRGRSPGADLVLTAYQALDAETAVKGFDFSSGSLARRRAAGVADMAAMIGQWRAAAPGRTGLVVHAAACAATPARAA